MTQEITDIENYKGMFLIGQPGQWQVCKTKTSPPLSFFKRRADAYKFIDRLQRVRQASRTSLSENLTRTLNRKNMTQRQFGEISGVSVIEIRQIIKQEKAINIDVLDKLAAALDVTSSFLLQS